MIIYRDILDQLKSHGYNTNRLRKEKLLSQSVMQSIRHNDPITIKNIDVICELLGCQPGDIIEYKENSPH